ncbi:hypothetical protein BJY52DRAFT_1228006 [Lactarius psammicola]|nr:hypothetical protein BJY52DRAFT_1228006 [Lactarius psammicola]
MTSHPRCCALYRSHLDHATLFNTSDVSGPEISDSNGREFDQPIDSHEDTELYHMDTDSIGNVPHAKPLACTETPDQDDAHQDRASFIKRFPSGLAGALISNAEHLGTKNIWSPFWSQCDWNFARWAKNWGPTSTAVMELLAIDGVVENLGLSYCNARELNCIIDEEMLGRPKFKYVDHTTQIFSEMHTRKWWWSVQQSLESRSPGATVVPIIISSDKTQLTLFRSKSAYPVYMSIGNIPKDIHCKPTQRAQMLMGYIPTTWLEHITNKAARCHALANLFHACMRKILSPIETYGETGIAMATGDRTWYRCHPILATFIGDYPEQSLVTCTYSGRCPKYIVPHDELGSHESFPLRDIQVAFDVFSLCDGDPTAFHAASQEAALKSTYHPFWERLPYTNIFLSITPDILHQLHQGIAKHLVRWLATLESEEIDARCSCLPPNHNARHFHKGITRLSRLSGQEHKDICRIILGVVVNLALPGIQSSACLTWAVRALLNFFYLSQYPLHTTESLNALDTALRQFHEEKDIFIELGVQEHFNLPKLHSLTHYRRSIMLFGSADNYNTEQSERLHIDFTKNAYRATNFKDEYKQMTIWLERQEAMHQHAALIELREGSSTLPMKPSPHYPSLPSIYPFLTTNPSEKGVSFESLANRYGAIDF